MDRKVLDICLSIVNSSAALSLIKSNLSYSCSDEPLSNYCLHDRGQLLAVSHCRGNRSKINHWILCQTYQLILTCTASGKMLQPFVTYMAKMQCILKIKAKECDVIVTTQSKVWMYHQLMLIWIRKVLVKYTKGRHASLVFHTFMRS